MAPKNGKNRRKPSSSSASKRPASGSMDVPGWESRVGGNMYQFKGPKEGFEAKAVEEGLYLRVDMPGVQDDDAEVWLEGKELFFSGKAHKVAEFEADPDRVYGGCIDLSSDPGKISEMKTVMKNGVLRIVLVGCGIQPGLSNCEPLWLPGLPSKPRAAHSSKALQREFSVFGDFLVSFRSMSFLETKDESSGIYPFQLSGPMAYFENICLDKDHIFMRVDMPDVPSHGVTVKVRNDVVLWGGEGAKGSEHDEEIRGYFGKNHQGCGCCNYVVLKSEVKYGVFRMLIELKKIRDAGESSNATANSERSDY